MILGKLLAAGNEYTLPRGLRIPRDTQEFLNTTYKSRVNSDTLVGIEIETENVRETTLGSDVNSRYLYDAFHHMWLWHEDGSLRNRGREFVTRLGITAREASIALEVLDDLFKRIFAGIQANARTGVHVHVNCGDLTSKQIASIAALYLLFEQSLFQFSGDRSKNIFCVPIRDSETRLPGLLRDVLAAGDDLKRGINLVWQHARGCPKYLGLNFGALSGLGTLEFRMGAGTNTPRSVIPWLEVLVSLVDYGKQQEYPKLLERIKALNTNSRYDELMDEVFPQWFIRSVERPNIRQDMIAGCTYIKEMLIDPAALHEIVANTPDRDDFDALLDEPAPPHRLAGHRERVVGMAFERGQRNANRPAGDGEDFFQHVGAPFAPDQAAAVEEALRQFQAPRRVARPALQVGPRPAPRRRGQ